MDKNTIERMLAPDLYVQVNSDKKPKARFIDALFSRPLGLTRFDGSVFADGFGVPAKLFPVAIDLPRRSVDVSATASFRTS
jgi:hypothetical protein